MLATLYLGVLLLTSLPAFQAWSADAVSGELATMLGTKVEIGKLRIGLLGRVVLDDIRLYDQRDSLMLEASRLAAKVDIMPLLERRIRIDNGQLFSAHAVIYKDGEEAPNFQFLVDALSAKDTTSKHPLDLGIGALVVRRGNIRYDRLDRPATPGRFNPDHLHIKDLNLTMRLLATMPDTAAIDLRLLSFREASGFTLQRLSLEAALSQKNAWLRDLHIEFPSSCIDMPLLTASYPGLEKVFTKEGLQQLVAETGIRAEVTPSDLKAFVPALEHFDDAVCLETEVLVGDGDVRIPSLTFYDTERHISLDANGIVQHFANNPSYSLNIDALRASANLQQFLTENLRGQAEELSPILTRLGNVLLTGRASYTDRLLTADVEATTQHGIVSVDGSLCQREVNATVRAEKVLLGYLLSGKENNDLGEISVETTLQGLLPAKEQPMHLTAEGIVSSLLFKGYEHHNVHFAAQADGEAYSGKLNMEESNGTILATVRSAKAGSTRSLECEAEVRNFSPFNMNLTKRYEGERFCGDLTAEIGSLDLDRLVGDIQLTGLSITSEDGGQLLPGDIHIASSLDEDIQHVVLESDFLDLHADGSFRWKTLPNSFQLPVSTTLPCLMSSSYKVDQTSANDFRFTLAVQDTSIIRRLLDTELLLPKRSIVEGMVSDAVGQIALQAHVPYLTFGEQQLSNIDLRAESNRSAIQASIQCERIMNDKPVEINLDAYAKDNHINTRLRWDNRQPIAQRGDINIMGAIRRDLDDRIAVDAQVNASNFIINDTVWSIYPAEVSYHEKVVDVRNLMVSCNDRHIAINGRASTLPTDTLTADLASIDLSYIFDLVNFHSVDFDGIASGRVYATSLMEKPVADAYLQVKQFTFNKADLGNMDIHGNWGSHDKSIWLDAHMRGAHPLHQTTVTGTITPGKGPGTGLDLNIKTSHIDLSFLNKFTGSIFRDLTGRASGWARVFGPFKQINLEGDLLLNELQTHVKAVGVDYHLEGDSVILRPDNIWLRGARLYDRAGVPGMTEHMATADVHLMHNCLKHLRYDVNIDAHNLLAYNFPVADERSYYGTAYADARLHLSGEPGKVDIDINATPTDGTTLIYNVASQGNLTETDFITYVAHSDSLEQAGKAAEEEDEISSDMHINFDLDITPAAQLKLLMDARSGDNIQLHGNGRIRASYYNKGRFQMYGTYRTVGGTYKMSFRDVIRKDFTFRPDGTIVFGGDALQAAINLQAVYTVPNVSLDDLSATGLGLSNTRVDCIMNISGRPKAPVVTFDFDIPNANEDEKQMVRAMINTEEERNMQVVYLLGLGRFFSYGTQFATGETQSGAAANSLLSSTLSSRINQLMSQALGSSNWSFGTNLRTGQTGWDQVDVEGMLSGRLLNNRLLINGNIGYRESMYNANRNSFIGDFDIQYRLTPRGSVSLKAYNQTNDRYFTQSSLTTQGIGIQFQRDFTRWKEAFRRSQEKKKP